MTRKHISLTICDRCGAEDREPDDPVAADKEETCLAPKDFPVRELQWQGTVVVQGEARANKFQDLCEECQKSFRAWVRGV